MAIQENEEYLIHAHFFVNGGYKNMKPYLGDLQSLRDAIALTWNQIPHVINIQEHNVEVMQSDGARPILAIFTFVVVSDELQMPTKFSS